MLVEQPVQTMIGRFEWQGPSTVGPSVDLSYPADLFTYAIVPDSSRFHLDLIDSGACLRANLRWTTQMNVGDIAFEFEAQPAKADECVKAIVAELPKMSQDDYFTDQELKDAVTAAEMDQALQREAPSELAHSLSFWWTSSRLEEASTVPPPLAAPVPLTERPPSAAARTLTPRSVETASMPMRILRIMVIGTSCARAMLVLIG